MSEQAGGVLGLIPARGGSKGIPRKNLAPLAGRPLIAHTIAAALASARLDRVVVSTDDPEIAAVAREHGAEVPFLRPAELADDTAPALAVIRHAIAALDAQGWRTQALAYLQPTSPLRTAQQIDAALAMLLEQGADSVVSVVEVPHNFSPLSVMRRQDDGRLTPYQEPDGPVPLRRQDKPRLWARNGPAVLALTRETVMDLGVLYGPRTLGLVMDRVDSLDIDEPLDLELAAWLLARRAGGE
ncbi:MAG: acylneuraminate cytidylyltransferase family protein [Desulfarculus sp.]|nr:acylneuraminate cytidylyltransferase family protein [Desulfarculus sp.]